MYRMGEQLDVKDEGEILADGPQAATNLLSGLQSSQGLTGQRAPPQLTLMAVGRPQVHPGCVLEHQFLATRGPFVGQLTA